MATIDLQAELERLVADPARVATSDAMRAQHAEDVSYHAPVLPDAVVFPLDRDEVAAVLRFAGAHGIAVTPFGAGSSLEGHVIPVRGGISLDLTRMDRIVAVRPGDFLAVVQPGVMRSQLNAALRDHGLHFPVDPGADCTLGGMAATNASGTTAVRYGVMRDQVLALEVVLADGSIVRTGGRAKKSSAGYDLTGLFVGSEGTLGVITQLTVRLHAVPEQTLAARAVFPSVETACRAATQIVGAGVPVERVELVDGTTVHAVNAYMETDYAEAPTLFVELAGSPTAVAADRELVEELAREEGCSSFEAETDPRARARLWEARHHAAFALIASAPGKGLMSTDACVPLSELPEAIGVARAAIERRGIRGALLGHVGDGNYHAAFMVDPASPEEIRVAEEVNDEIVRDALARGGTCTGEHGIGLGKLHYLEAEHGDALPLMRSLKALLDPAGIMNPGKVVG